VSSSFADLGVPSSILKSLAARRIDTPFPIQVATLPDALAGRDLCGRAPTGSGKTIAFGIPLVLGVGKAKPRRPRGLVLVPTRELAAQVGQELQLLSAPKGPRVETFYGGVGFDRQIKALTRGVDILVACPGRLADLINQRYVNLGDIQFVVIDEADRMADMGFLPEVRRLLDQCPADRQTLLFSATLDGDVDVLISKYQRHPARHEVFSDEDDDKAEHFFWRVDRENRLTTAASVIKRLGPTIVFCRTKRGADRIARQLEATGVRSAAIHGDRSQSQRDRALQSFHQGRVDALVATDVAARGIHVDGVAGVVHFDPPADHKDYVHRSGRTARAGQRGCVVSLVAPELRKAVGALQKDLGYKIGLDPIDLAALAESDRPVRSERPVRPVRPVREPHPVRDERPMRPAATGRPERATRTERPVRVERAERVERHEPVERPAPAARVERSFGDDRPDRVRVERGTRPSRPVRVEVDRVMDLTREPLAPGQRRPSGASRRKAKRLAAAEMAMLGLDSPATTRPSRSADHPRPGKPARGRSGSVGAGRSRASNSGKPKPSAKRGLASRGTGSRGSSSSRRSSPSSGRA
jgi:superfamily II DNA/RNA helicase